MRKVLPFKSNFNFKNFPISSSRALIILLIPKQTKKYRIRSASTVGIVSMFGENSSPSSVILGLWTSNKNNTSHTSSRTLDYKRFV